mmetsp:Transcript_74804/g.173295  ORF Transcript_74804/g.173295 Transcript_74804/m.173295 type:complete len:639 (+) Transcript_74804:129-2045(+)
MPLCLVAHSRPTRPQQLGAAFLLEWTAIASHGALATAVRGSDLTGIALLQVRVEASQAQPTESEVAARLNGAPEIKLPNSTHDRQKRTPGAMPSSTLPLRNATSREARATRMFSFFNKTFRGVQEKSLEPLQDTRMSIGSTAFPLVLCVTSFGLLFASHWCEPLALLASALLDPRQSEDGGKRAADAELQAAREVIKREVRQLRMGCWIALTVMAIELAGGVLTNSLALTSDAVHLFSDIAGFLVAIFTLQLMSKRTVKSMSFGFQQAAALGALLSMVTVWVMIVTLLVQAITRLVTLTPVDGRFMSLVAAFGLLANLTLLATLGHLHAPSLAHELGKCGCPPPPSPPELVAPQSQLAIAKPMATQAPAPLALGEADAPPLEASPQPPVTEGLPPPEALPVTLQALPPPPPVPAAREPRKGRGGRGTPAAKFCQNFQPPTSQAPSLAFRASVIHIVGDILQSLGALIAGVFMWWKPVSLGTASGHSRWYYLDPIVTILLVAITFVTTVGTTKQAILELLLYCPVEDLAETVQQRLLRVRGVVTVHDLHIWNLGPSRLCTGHIVTVDAQQCSEVLQQCIAIAQLEFEISHATFQIEVKGEFNHTAEKLQLGAISCHDMHCPPESKCFSEVRSPSKFKSS